VSPGLRTDLSGLPPARVITFEFDPLRDEGRAYAAPLASAGVPSVNRHYYSLIHSGLELAAVVPASQVLLKDVPTRLVDFSQGEMWRAPNETPASARFHKSPP